MAKPYVPFYNVPQLQRQVTREYLQQFTPKTPRKLDVGVRLIGNYGQRINNMTYENRQQYIKIMQEQYPNVNMPELVRKIEKVKSPAYQNAIKEVTQYTRKKNLNPDDLIEIYSTAYDKPMRTHRYKKGTNIEKGKPGPKRKPGRPPLTEKEKQKREKEKERKKRQERKKKDPTVSVNAPYGRKKDGTPKQKPGRKIDDETKDKKPPVDFVDEPPKPEDIIRPQPSPDDVYEPADDRIPEQPTQPPFEPADETIPEPPQTEPYEPSDDTPDLSDIPTKDLVKEEEKPAVIILPENEDPEKELLTAIGKRANKARVATENWFRCARIEFGRNIGRLPVLIDLATRVANLDPRLLFKPRTEIDYWYHVFGWQRADELIQNLENVSGLSASSDIKGYTDNEDRNRKIRRWYAKRLRYNIREELRGTYSSTDLENEVRKRMRELGYEY